MSLNLQNAKNLVGWLDSLYPPKDTSNRQREQALAEELVAAFAKTDVRETDLHGFVIQWRRPMSDDEDERIRTLTRPSGWDLRRLYDQARRVAETRAPAKGCQDCHDKGRRVAMAVVWHNGLLRVEPLVVACNCGQARFWTLDTMGQLETVAEWRRRVRDGSARFQGDPMALVVDESPVFEEEVLHELAGLGQGEVVDEQLAAHVDLVVLRTRDSYGQDGARGV